MAVGFSKMYGISALAAEKSILVDFKVRTFSRIVERLKLTGQQQAIAKALGMEPSFSLDVLSTLTEMPAEDLVRNVRSLIDYSLVINSADHYSLAGPIRDTVYRAFGLLTSEDFSAMARRLKSKYWAETDSVPPLDAIDATIYTVARGGNDDLSQFADIMLPSTLLKIANEAYNDRQWSLANDFAKRALSADPASEKPLVILCKSSVRLAHEGKLDWSDAEASVASAERKGIRGRQYLRGFLEWKRGNPQEAVKAYYAAEKSGDRSVGVYRDRAYCLFRLGQIEDASKDVKLALERYPRNNYIVDLAAEIAIARGRFSEAEDLLNDLQKIDVRENFYHRRATLKAARKQFDDALRDAEIALQRDPPLHEMYAHHVDILIELSRFDDAEHELSDISHRFRGRNARDVQTGLRCKLELRRGNWQKAEEYYLQLHLKESPVPQGLYREILRRKSQDLGISLEQRQRAALQLAAIEDNKTAKP